MSTIYDPKGNCFGFQCNCGFTRMVTDAELNFRCERPVVDSTEKKCTFYYQAIPNGGGSGIPTVKRVNSSGVDQSDNAAVVQTGAVGSEIAGVDVASDSVDGLSIAADGSIG